MRLVRLVIIGLLFATPAWAQGGTEINIEGALRAPYLMAFGARDGQFNFVRQALLNGVSPNARDPEGRPAIVLASMNGHDGVVRLLCEANARTDMTDNGRNSALTLAASRGHLAVVNVLIRARANVNHPNSVGETPLMVAARAGHVPVVEALLRANANVNATDLTGRSALAWAQTGNRRTVVEILRRAGGR